MRRIALLTLLMLFFTSEVVAKSLLIDKIPITQKIVALTLEDLEDAASLKSVIQICRKEAVRLTIFCPGEFVQREKHDIEELISLGCEIGICGVKYQPWDELREEEIRREYVLAKNMLPGLALQEVLVVHPPYDYYDKNVMSALNGADQVLVVRGTSIDNGIRAGSIINIKINDKNSIEKLQDSIIKVKAGNYQIETVLNLLKKSRLTIGH